MRGYPLFDRWADRITVGVSTLAEGCMEMGFTDSPACVHAHREALLQEYCIEYNNTVAIPDLRVPNILERERIHEITAKDLLNRFVGGVDALVTSQVRATFLFRVGDCLAIPFYDTRQHRMALCHAGRQGVNFEIPLLTLAAMGSDPKEVIVLFPPSLKKASFVFENIHSFTNPGWSNFIQESDDGFHIDMNGFALQQLLDAGVPAQNIFIDSQDTYTDGPYSHLRWQRKGHEKNRPPGRFAVFCHLKPLP